MKILRTQTTVLRNAAGKVLKIRPDTYIEPNDDLFMVEIAVEDGQVITLPTPNLAQGNVAHQIAYYTSYNGTPVATSSNTSTPSITATLLADTEYYIRLVPNTTEYMFTMQVTGNGTAVPTPEAGVTSITVGTPLTGQYAFYNTAYWFKFKTTAAGSYVMSCPMGTYPAYNYNINWDYVNGTIPEVTGVTTYNSASATYTYEFAGTYIIAISGSMPGWAVDNTGNIRLLITRCISWGNVGLKVINWNGCTAMTTLPIQDSKLTQVLRFTNFCANCTSLVSIPYGVFFGNTIAADFQYAFYNCISLRSIPQTTFRDNTGAKVFTYTFASCNKLTTLPSKLFEFCYQVESFVFTFSRCSLINNLPADLFYRAMMDIDYSRISASSMNSTFYFCTALTSIPLGFFSSPQPDNLGLNIIKASTLACCFCECSALASIPEYMFHNQIYCTSGQGAFNSCSALTVIPRSCFEGCTTMTIVGSYVYQDGYRYGAFGACTNLVTIEQDCFKDCISCTDFSWLCRQDTKLVSVGANMFDNCGAAITYEGTFYYCTSLTTLCADIFDDSPLVTNFTTTFYNTKIHSDSVGGVYQLDPEIFKFNTKVVYFTSTFSSCPNIVNIPEILFSTCIEAYTFQATFQSCPNITAIPPLLFRNNYKVYIFSSTFQGCTGITRIPLINEGGIDYGFFYFNPQVRNFMQTFASCRLTNGVDYDAIPQITFYNNLEVTGIYTGYPQNESNSFNGIFQGNTTLQSIPDYLFLYNSKAQDFNYVFSGCTSASLTSLPAHLFSGVTNADRFDYSFDAVKITSIPGTLFEDCVAAKSFAGTFRGTNITSIPVDLFGTLTKGPKGVPNNFTYTFQNCTLLTTIPAGLFYYNYNATTFAYCFAGCTSLVTVPDTLFKLNGTTTSVTGSFSNTFNGCSKLENIGTNLFKYNEGALDFTATFYECRRLSQSAYIFYNAGEQTTRFANKTMTFTNCFYRTAGDVLDLYMSYSLTYNGALIANDDNSAGNFQPQMSRSLVANTNYYIKITVVGATDSGLFDILVTGGTGPGAPTPETDCTLLSVGTTLTGESISGAQVKWYKFQTTTAGTYVFKTLVNTTEQNSRMSTAPDLWNCTYNYVPVKTICWGTIAGNNENTLTNFASIPIEWR